MYISTAVYVHMYICIYMWCTFHYNFKNLTLVHLASTDDEVTSISHGDSDRPEEAVPIHKFDVGSKIKHVHCYGVIKWIGNLPGLSNKVYAGVEMVGNVLQVVTFIYLIQVTLVCTY